MSGVGTGDTPDTLPGVLGAGWAGPLVGSATAGTPALPDLPDLLAPGQAPGGTQVALTLLIAVVATGYRPVWRVLRHVVTIAHEGGHAGVAALTGRRLHGVRLHSDTSGLTVSAGRPTGPGVVFTLLAGYLAPSVLGLAAAVALTFGWVRPVLWVAIGLLAALLVMIRNLFGVLTVVVTAGVLVAVAGWAPSGWRVVAAYLLTWFLLVAAPRPVLELQVTRSRRLARASDADQLARLTRLPGLFWVCTFLVLTVAALGVGGWLLIAPALPS
jgi:hypothetical protein